MGAGVGTGAGVTAGTGARVGADVGAGEGAAVGTGVTVGGAVQSIAVNDDIVATNPAALRLPSEVNTKRATVSATTTSVPPATPESCRTRLDETLTDPR